MIRGISIAVTFILFTAGPSDAERRFARPGDGLALGQSILPLQDGTFYATIDQRIVAPDLVLSPQEAAVHHKRVTNYLDQFRYWESGVPPKTTALERYLKAWRHTGDAEKIRGILIQRLSEDNWLKFGALPKRDGG